MSMFDTEADSLLRVTGQASLFLKAHRLEALQALLVDGSCPDSCLFNL